MGKPAKKREPRRSGWGGVRDRASARPLTTRVLEDPNQASRDDPEIGQSALAKAQRMAQEELSALGWTTQEPQGQRKSDPQRVQIHARLRRETTMTLEWIGEQLRRGAATHVATLLQRHQRREVNSEESLF